MNYTGNFRGLRLQWRETELKHCILLNCHKPYNNDLKGFFQNSTRCFLHTFEPFQRFPFIDEYLCPL